MTRRQAINLAISVADKKQEPRFVVYDPSHPFATTPDNSYFVTSEEGLYTYFEGCTNVTEVLPR